MHSMEVQIGADSPNPDPWPFEPKISKSRHCVED